MSRLDNISDGIEESGLVCWLFYHIENPCEVIINKKTVNIRPFYLRMAKEILPKIRNLLLKEGLEKFIDYYESC